MFIATKQILAQNKVVPAFNFSTAEVARAIVEVCDELNQDVILQTSMSEAKFLGLDVAVGIARALGQRSEISISLHLDHADNLEIIKAALDAGYTSFLAGGSKVSLGFDESVEFVNGARKLAGEDVVVEAVLTEFDRAEEFVEKTNPDLLAPFSIVNSEDVSEIDKIEQVHKLVSTPLVLHDASLKSAEEIKAAIASGVVKVNLSVRLRLAWSGALRQMLDSSPKEFRPYRILQPSVDAVKEVVRGKVGMLR